MRSHFDRPLFVLGCLCDLTVWHAVRQDQGTSHHEFAHMPPNGPAGTTHTDMREADHILSVQSSVRAATQAMLMTMLDHPSLVRAYKVRAISSSTSTFECNEHACAFGFRVCNAVRSLPCCSGH